MWCLCWVWRSAPSTVTLQPSGRWAWFGSTLTLTSTRRWPRLQETSTDSPCLTSSMSCRPRWALVPRTSQNQTEVSSFNLVVRCVTRFPSYQTSPGSNRVFQPKISSTSVWETWIQRSSKFLTLRPLRSCYGHPCTALCGRSHSSRDMSVWTKVDRDTANVAKTVALDLPKRHEAIFFFYFNWFLYFDSYILKLLGVKVFSISDVDQLGVARVMEETCDYISAK